jgi:hypothetical protein
VAAAADVVAAAGQAGFVENAPWWVIERDHSAGRAVVAAVGLVVVAVGSAVVGDR